MFITRREFYLDIEVLWDEVEVFDIVVKKGSSPIQMIGCYDNYNYKYYSFFFHKDVEIVQDDKLDPLIKKKKKSISRRVRNNKFNLGKSNKWKSSETDNTYDCMFLYFKNERSMLSAFMKFVWDISPDVYSGFFVETFDLVYIINRCRALHIDYTYLSCLRNVYISHFKANINGAAIYDIPNTYAHFMGSHRHANSLKKISESHLKGEGDKKITKTSENILHEDWYEKDWDAFINYCLVDVELCVLLEEKLGLIREADRLEKFTGVNPKFFAFESHVIEMFFYLLKPIYERDVLNNEYKIAFPTKKGSSVDRAAGAYVFVSKAGFYIQGTIIIADLSKMYPEIIRSLNISVETLRLTVDEKERHKYIYATENDVYYRKDVIGFVPFILGYMFKIRDQVEEIRDSYEYGSKEWKEWNEKRQTVKDLINAVSGQFDYFKSIILKPPCANSIRLTGQKEIMLSAKFAEMFGKATGVKLDVIYGDTDSIFIWFPHIKDERVCEQITEEMCKWIQKGYDIFAKEMNIDKHNFKIGLEKVMDVYTSIGKKKKYFANVLLSDGIEVKKENSFYIRGYESIRSDSSEFTGKGQKEIFKLMCSVKDEEKKIRKKNKNMTDLEVLKSAWNITRRKIISKIRNEYMDKFSEDNLLEIGIPRKMTMDFGGNDFDNLGSYKVTNPWIGGCKYANKYLGASFGRGSKPKLIYIKEVRNVGSKKYPPTNVLCVEEGMVVPEGVFVVDKDKMITKTLFDKVAPTLNVAGLTKDEILTGKRVKTVLDYIGMSEVGFKFIPQPAKELSVEEVIKISERELKKIKV